MYRFVFIIILLTSVVNCSPKKKNTEEQTNFDTLKTEIISELDNVENELLKIDQKLEINYEEFYKGKKFSNLQDYKLNTNGTLWAKQNDKINSELWVSGVIKIDQKIKDLSIMTEAIDDLLVLAVSNSKVIVQSYYNDQHSLNRIYPPVDALKQYEPKMDITKFNFYYEADSSHNPNKNVVWVKDAYVDPAGRGWMISSISPVYYKSSLEGVLGLDITIENFLQKFSMLQKNNILIVQENGTIIYSSEKIGNLLYLPKFDDHNYFQTIKSNTFKPEKFNLNNNPKQEVRDLMLKLKDHKISEIKEIIIDQKSYNIRKFPISRIGWIVVEISDDNE